MFHQLGPLRSLIFSSVVNCWTKPETEASRKAYDMGGVIRVCLAKERGYGAYYLYMTVVCSEKPRWCLNGPSQKRR